MKKIMVTVLLLGLTAALLAACPSVASAKTREGILLVAFGTSEPEARGAVDGIVEAVKKGFPGVEVRLAYTSNIIRRKILREEGLDIDSPLLALARMQDEGIRSVTVQSLHIIPGEEYDQLTEAAGAFRGIGGKYGFDRLAVGAPLLYSFDDYEKTAALLKKKYGRLADDGGAVVFMGHGTHHHANGAYSQMQALFDHEGLPFVMGVVEGFPGLDTVKGRLASMKPRQVTLVPFMVVAGDHARNDMADEEDPESWISELRGEGYDVKAVLQGLGDGEGLAELFIDHIREAGGGQ